MSARTFSNIQSAYLIPAVQAFWGQEQQQLLKNVIQNGPVMLGGDGRCCSPGHTAKFGSYSMMDLNSNKVLDMQLVQVMIFFHLVQNF